MKLHEFEVRQGSPRLVCQHETIAGGLNRIGRECIKTRHASRSQHHRPRGKKFKGIAPSGNECPDDPVSVRSQSDYPCLRPGNGGKRLGFLNQIGGNRPTGHSVRAMHNPGSIMSRFLG